MLSSLNSGVSGIREMQQRMDVIGNNIANVNTTGYKAARIGFEDTFSQNLLGANRQVGTGVGTGGISNLFNQGAITTTSKGTDLAIAGEGFFVVANPADAAQFATRAGDFKLDPAGYLVTNQGFRVQGFSDPGLATRGDIMIDATGAPATAAPGSSVTGMSIDDYGRINVQLSDGTKFVRGQVLLQNFRDPQALTKAGGNLYSGLATAGPMTQTQAPSTNGLGAVKAGSLELSNVDLTDEFSTMITTQRAFQANARVITTSDEMLQDVVNLKR